MMRQYQLYYKQELVCETISEYDLQQYFLKHYDQFVRKPNNKKVGNRRIGLLPDYPPTKLLEMLYHNQLTNYQLNLRSVYIELSNFEEINLEEILKKQRGNP